MAFSGPGGDYNAGTRARYQRVLDMAQDSEDGFYTGRPRQASGVARVDTSLLDRYDQQEREKAQVAMRPGVRRGGSTATRAQSDSPLNVGRAKLFNVGGDQFSYDPIAAAEETGTAQAAGEGAQDKARYDNLVKMPGFTPRLASRVVFGRGDVFDPDVANQALAQYVRQPTRESAATAIESGVSQFSPMFGGSFDPEGRRARPGTEEALEMRLRQFEQEQLIREERAKREAQLRAELRPEPRDRMALRTNKDGGVDIINIDDETERPRASGVVTARPGARAAGARAAFMRPPGDSAAAPAAKPTTPEQGAAQFVTPPSTAKADPNFPGMSMDEIREAAFQALVNDGVDDPSPSQLRESMSRISLARQQMRAGRVPRSR